ncbi:hypothetical protein PG991_010399 [Apiospora marii]|uniref:Uncharacterized protein n=1 Tax=Apiospora marii TaxID=335849 RepID=A0ABR1RKF6_9PEZI
MFGAAASKGSSEGGSGELDVEKIPSRSDRARLKEDVKCEEWGWQESQQYDEDLAKLYERITCLLLGIPSPGRSLKVHYKELVDCILASKLEASPKNDDLEKLLRDFVAVVEVVIHDYRIKARGKPCDDAGIRSLLQRHTILGIIQSIQENIETLHQDIRKAYRKVLHIIADQLRDTPWFIVIETDDFFGPLLWKEGIAEEQN